MTQQQHAEPTTAPRRGLRYAAVAVAVIVLAAGAILLIKLLSGPAPVDYKITVRGVVGATFTTPDESGPITLTDGSGARTVRAGKVAVTVNSTAADGASCTITDPAGNVVDTEQSPADARGFVTVSCSTQP